MKLKINMNYNRFFLTLLTIVFLTVPAITQAANTVLNFTGPAKVGQNSVFTVYAKASSNIAINTIEGSINYSSELLSVRNIRYNNSILKFWPELPSNKNGNNVSFIGGLPNPGFSGNNGGILEIQFIAKTTGKAVISFEPSTQVLLNDGQGTNTSWTAEPLYVTITKATTPPSPTPLVTKDTAPPTNLELIIGRDSYLYSGEWFAVFQAEDKESGIDYYEIAEIDPEKNSPENTNWAKATSPYRLQKQTENTKVFLKAVDKAGNEAVISRTHSPENAKDYYTELLLALLCFALLLALLNTYTQLRGWKKYITSQKQKKLL